MNSSNYRFSLDMHTAQSQISIPAMLGDTSRTLYITLSDGGKSYTIANGCLAKISIKRPTGTSFEEFCAIERNSTIVYQFSQNENTAAVVGIHECDVTLYNSNGGKITSPRFTMVVHETAVNTYDLDIPDEDRTLIDAMIDAEASRVDAEKGRVTAETDRVNAELARVEAEKQRELKLDKALDEFDDLRNEACVTSYHDSIQEMKADSKLETGRCAVTHGYHSFGDGGGATYIIRAKFDSDKEDGGKIHFLENGFVAELVVNGNKINVKQFGAKGDGITDDADAIKTAIKALPKENAVLYFPPGIYIHGDGVETGLSYPIKAGTSNQPDVTVETADVGKDIRFYMDGYHSLTVLGYDAEIRSNDGNGETRNNAMFIFTNCSDLKIKGLKLDGRRQERHVFMLDWIPGDPSSFLQSNITLDDCQRVLVEDVVSINSVHDGISLNWGTNDVKIINCIVDNAQRNGIAVCGCKNVSILNTQCNDTGTSGGNYQGIAPKAGIDVEGHLEEYPNENVLIYNCNMENNVTQGISIANWTHHVTIDNCVFKNNRTSVTEGIYSGHPISDITIRNSTLINSVLNSKFNLAENNYVESTYANNVEGRFSYTYDDTDNDATILHICRNNVFKFNWSGEVTSESYFGIRLNKKLHFVGNRVIDAFSLTANFYPIILGNELCENNSFELSVISIGGISVNNHIGLPDTYSGNQKRKNNIFSGYVTYGASLDMNESLVTDFSITKSYGFGYSIANKIFKVNTKASYVRINAFYLGQEEELIVSTASMTSIKHTIKSKSNSADFTMDSIVELHMVYPYFYIKVLAPYAKFTVYAHEDYIGQYLIDEEFLVDVTDTSPLTTSSRIPIQRVFGEGGYRPSFNVIEGTCYFDMSLGMPIWWNGFEWVDSKGSPQY